MNIINLSTMDILRLAEAATRADNEGRRFRVAFNPGGESYRGGVRNPNEPASISYKVGEGMWSAPLYDQIEDDPYRDNPFPGGTYQHTHESVYDGSPAMMVSRSENTITLVNEDGHVWTDHIRYWNPIE